MMSWTDTMSANTQKISIEHLHIHELLFQKTYLLTRAPSEDSHEASHLDNMIYDQNWNLHCAQFG